AKQPNSRPFHSLSQGVSHGHGWHSAHRHARRLGWLRDVHARHPSRHDVQAARPGAGRPAPLRGHDGEGGQGWWRPHRLPAAAVLQVTTGARPAPIIPYLESPMFGFVLVAYQCWVIAYAAMYGDSE